MIYFANAINVLYSTYVYILYEICWFLLIKIILGTVILKKDFLKIKDINLLINIHILCIVLSN